MEVGGGDAAHTNSRNHIKLETDTNITHQPVKSETDCHTQNHSTHVKSEEKSGDTSVTVVDSESKVIWEATVDLQKLNDLQTSARYPDNPEANDAPEDHENQEDTSDSETTNDPDAPDAPDAPDEQQGSQLTAVDRKTDQKKIQPDCIPGDTDAGPKISGYWSVQSPDDLDLASGDLDRLSDPEPEKPVTRISPQKRPHDDVGERHLLDISEQRVTSVYHQASRSQSVSQLLKSSRQPHTAMATTASTAVTTTKIIDVALPVADSDCDYLIDPTNGTISCHVSSHGSPTKVMRLTDISKTATSPATKPLCVPSGQAQPQTDRMSGGHTHAGQTDGPRCSTPTPGDGGMAAGMSQFFDTFNTQIPRENILCDMMADTVELDQLANIPTYNRVNANINKVEDRRSSHMFTGSDIFNSAHINDVCELRNTSGYSRHIEKSNMSGSSKYVHVNQSNHEVNTSQAVHEDRVVQDVWRIPKPNSRPQAWSTGDSGNLAGLYSSHGNKENCGDGGHVLSTWKVNLNKGQRIEQPPIYNNLASMGSMGSIGGVGSMAKPAASTTERTLQHNSGRYVYPSQSRDPEPHARPILPSHSKSLHNLHTSPLKEAMRSLSTPSFHSTPTYPHTSATYASRNLNSSDSDDDLGSDILAGFYDHFPPERSNSPTLIPTAGQLNEALFRATESLSEADLTLGRQAHNAKERARRARIKLACEHLRDLVPGMTLKTDKATVFEFAVQYIAFLRRFIGIQYDKEFLRNCNPY